MTRRVHARSRRHRQAGAALIVAVLLFALIGISALIAVARGTDSQAEKDRRTAEALAQAKAALIGYAVDVVLDSFRLGELPCPDTDDDGTAIISATGLPEVCDAQEKRLGRLPWKTLGLPDLRDGDGERLWYAVSSSFKRDNASHCGLPTDPDCINSDSLGTITVRDPVGNPVYDATPTGRTGVIAVVIAPGAVLTREGAGAPQDRSSGGKNIASNYLDIAMGEDNANFIDGTMNGFINGPIRQAGNVIVNDRIAVITYQDLIPLLEKRVAREVGVCLDQYATANGGRYPWAADTSQAALNNRFSDPSGNRGGRVPDGTIGSVNPDQVFTNTRIDSGNTMADIWPGPPCNLGRDLAWWTNWKLHVFYAMSDTYSPSAVPNCSVPVAPCLRIMRPIGPLPGARYFVTVAGKPLAGQQRLDPGQRANPANYLEGNNAVIATTPEVFDEHRSDIPFNDVAVYK